MNAPPRFLVVLGLLALSLGCEAGDAPVQAPAVQKVPDMNQLARAVELATTAAEVRSAIIAAVPENYRAQLLRLLEEGSKDGHFLRAPKDPGLQSALDRLASLIEAERKQP